MTALRLCSTWKEDVFPGDRTILLLRLTWRLVVVARRRSQRETQSTACRQPTGRRRFGVGPSGCSDAAARTGDLEASLGRCTRRDTTSMRSPSCGSPPLRLKRGGTLKNDILQLRVIAQSEEAQEVTCTPGVLGSHNAQTSRVFHTSWVYELVPGVSGQDAQASCPDTASV